MSTEPMPAEPRGSESQPNLERGNDPVGPFASNIGEFDLVTAKRIRGANIYTVAGDHIGTVTDLMIDKATGRIAYAIISCGGFLGLGAERRALPWAALLRDATRDGFVINASEAVLKGMPPLGPLGDREWGRKLHDHFGVSPYWS